MVYDLGGIVIMLGCQPLLSESADETLIFGMALK